MPTLIAAVAGVAISLVTPLASSLLGPLLYRLTSLWSLEDLIGHILGIVCACIMAYLVFSQFGDDASLRELFGRWIAPPATLTIPVLTALFIRSDGCRRYSENFNDVDGGPYLIAYWITLCVIMLYLLGISGYGLMILHQRRPGPTVTLHLFTTGLTMLCIILVTIHATTSIDIGELIAALGYLCAIGWCATPGVSWLLKRPAGMLEA